MIDFSMQGETVNILKERASDAGEGVIVQLNDFCSKMDELHNHLNRLRVFLENITDEINSNTSASNANSAIESERKYTGLRG